MAETTHAFFSIANARNRLRPMVGAMTCLGVLALVGAFWMPEPTLAIILFACAMVLGFVALIAGVRQDRRRDEAPLADPTYGLVADDAMPVLIARAGGKILYANSAAVRTLDASVGGTLDALLKQSFANPGPILGRLERRAAKKGAAHEDIASGAGRTRLCVHRAGHARYLWRFENSGDLPLRDADPLPLPMLTVGRNNAVLFMNAAARKLVGERARSLDRIFPKLPLRSGQINDVNGRQGLISCLAVELKAIAGRREVFLLPGIAPTERLPDGWAFFDELPVPLLKLKRDGDIQLSNRPARDLLGVETCAGVVLSDLMEGLGRSIPDWLKDAASGRGGVTPEFLRVRRDDRETFVQVTLNRATEAGETVLIAVLSDATKLKSLEAQFVQSQKMQAIGQLAGGVAHDFNNLLTAITGHCDLLLLRHDQGDTDYADLVQINQNANRAAALVSQLLAYSRKQTLRPQVMDLRDMLSDLMHLLNRLVGEKMVLSLSHDPVLWSIRADKRQLEQVLMNLVVNARDAMPDGGEIEITTENLTLDDPLRRDRAMVAPGRYVRVTVQDDGVGITPDKVQKVFEPFYTTKRAGEGTGLGLSTAYGIVKQTGGFIFVDSEPGEGARFQLLFPAYEAMASETQVKSETSPVDAQRDGIVLLVEDEAPVRAFASRALQMRGLTVLEADSAETALDLLSDERLHVDVFLSDVVMPGMDGPSWVIHALKARPATRVVFMSGYAEETFGEIQAGIPNSVFLPKPFSLTELTETVQRQLIPSTPAKAQV